MRGASDFPDPSGSGLAERRDESGVSLVEILIVLALIATLALISLPGLVALLRGFEVRKATVGVAQAFREAQALAQSSGSNYIVVVNPVKNTNPQKFCWDVPGERIYAIVKDVSGDCTIGPTTDEPADCTSDDVEFDSWGPVPHRLVSFLRFPIADEPIDIGGSGATTDQTICFTPRGTVGSETAVGTGVYIGSDGESLYRRVTVNASGRIKTQRYKGGSYQD